MNIAQIKKILGYAPITLLEKIIIVISCLFAIIFTMIRPIIISSLTDQGLIAANYKYIFKWIAVLLVISCIELLNEFVQCKIFTRIGNGFSFNLYNEALKKLIKSPIEKNNDLNSVEIFNMIECDISRVMMMMDKNVLIMGTYVFRVLGGIMGLLILDINLTILILLFIPVKLIVVVFFSRRKEVISKKHIKAWKSFSGWFGNQINGLKEIKLWNLYKKKEKEFARYYSDIPKTAYSNAMLDCAEECVSDSIIVILECFIYLTGGYYVCSNKMSVGDVIAFLNYTMCVFGPLGAFTKIPYIWSYIKPSADRLCKLYELEEEPCNVIIREGIAKKVETIEIRNVGFAYEKGYKVFEGVNLRIKKGSKIAIIGTNGSGKTTLINLLLGFFLPQEGNILINGKSIDEIGIENWRNYFALVGQDRIFFNGSIMENIDLSGIIPIQKFNEMLDIYGMKSIFESIKNKGNGRIEEGGKNLSSGEQQKILLLRALVRNADCLILDEVTTNLDDEMKKVLQEMIDENLATKTVIFITHHREELKGMDYIYEIKDRQIKRWNGFEELNSND